MKRFIIVALAGFALGCFANYVSTIKTIKSYRLYYECVEKVLDECQKWHNIMDTVGEDDAYQDYLDAKDNL